MNNQISEPEQDGGVIYESTERQKMEPESLAFGKPEFPNNEYHDISSNHVAAENQTGETSKNANDNVIYQSADSKAEEERMMKGDSNMLSNAPPHKENGDNLPGPNTIVLVQMTSSKL